MGIESGTLSTLTRHLVLALAPLRAGVADLPAFRTLLSRLAWEVESLPPEFTALAAKVDAAITALDALGADPPPEKVLDVLDKVSRLYSALRGITTAPAGVDPAVFLDEVALGLVDVLLVDYLVDQLPGVHALLRALGIITQEFTVETPARPSVLRSRIRWDEIPTVLSDPNSIPIRLYGWGTDDLNFAPLAKHLLHLFVALGWPAYIGPLQEELGKGFLETPHDSRARINWALKIPVILDNINDKEIEVGAALLEFPAQGGKPAGLILQPLVPPEVGTAYDVTDDLKLEVRAGSDVAKTFGVLLRPEGDISVKFPLDDSATLPDAGFGVTLRYAPENAAMLLGTAGKSRLELKGAATSLNLDLHDGQLDLQLQAAPQDLKLIIAATDLDGFLGQLLGEGEKTIPIALAAQWSNRTGLNFTGGAGLEVSTHPHWSLGPLRVDRVDLAIKSTVSNSQPPDMKADVTTALSGSLGPVTFAAEGLGVRLHVIVSDGNAGPFDIQYGFAPPHGLGIRVDAGPIVGGGFLSFEPDKGRYSGALQLDVYGTALKAIGLLETRLPGSAFGYSFVILISTEFTPIQLGLGFTLNGVGGVAAIHRGLATDALQAGLRSGSVDNLLFPSDPIANAPQILSDLSTIFPAARGRYVFGPIALIGWGTPPLMEAKIGVVLELPSPVRLTLLGLIAVKLPTKEEAIVELHVAVFGRVEFARKLLAIDASLFDSTVAGFPVSGDMALRLDLAGRPDLVVALGGLNPHFQPPAAFPALKRLTIALSSGDNPRLTCQAYLALTPNTLQFGARAELYAAAAGFNVKGWVSFDCLIQRFPFSLRADLAADVAFRRRERVLASVHLDASLTGPAPWHVWGEASLSLWLFDVSVGFDVKFGPSLPPPLPALDPWPLLQAAIADARNWSSTFPAGAFQVVTRRGTSGSDVPLMVDPGAAATLRQSVLPLNRTLTRFGPAKPVGPDHYSLDADSVTINGVVAPDVVTITDYFAAAQFEELSNTDRLSRPSFERMDAGLTLGGDAVGAGPAVGIGVDFETIILDVPWKPRHGPRYALPLTHQLTLLERGSSAQAPLTTSGFTRFAPQPASLAKIALDEEAYVVCGVDNAALFSGLAGAFSKGAALAALASYLKAHPEDTGRFQVVPQHEAVEPS